MTKYEIPEALINWTQGILMDRNLTVSLDKETNKFFPLDFSPLLCA